MYNGELFIPFTVTNGVRQGGVLSPYLFAVFLDELSIQLDSTRVGCTVGNMIVNHLRVADDICVFSPSISGLLCLLNICGDYATEITFNCKKTIGVLSCPTKVQIIYSIMFFWMCTIFWPSEIPWCVAKWRMMMISRDKWNCCTVQQTSAEAYALSADLQ